MREAAATGCRLVVFPELALTTFFPRYLIEDSADLDAFFETEMPGPETRALFDEAVRLGIGFHLGYGELAREDGTVHHYNSAILADTDGTITGKYRKIHLPGHVEPLPDAPFQHLEKRYFEVGDLGFPVWRTMDGILGILICNDRRWPEAFRCLGLQGVEMVLIGYNTPASNIDQRPEPSHLRGFHNGLSLQRGPTRTGPG